MDNDAEKIEENKSMKNKELGSNKRIFCQKYSVIINIVLAVFTAGLFSVAYFSLDNQSDYYKATTRPFVNYTGQIKPTYEYKNPTEIITICIKNYGHLPAKNVQFKSVFKAVKDTLFLFDFDPEDAVAMLYPDEDYFVTTTEKEIDYNDSNETFFHIFIFYEDMGGNKYHSLNIIYIPPNAESRVVYSDGI